MADLIGHELGNFTLTRIIGQGGMGTVYLAEHKWIGRRKAVKILDEDKARNAAMVRRFFHEAMAASACQHDHIISIEDCGTFQTRDGVAHHYIEMEHLEGEDVAAACRPTGRFEDMQRAVKIAAYVADALAVAHERGIVHRDLKPGNVFLSRRGTRSDYVKVLDFGIARLTGEMAPGNHTRTGSVIGTPEYMSPEQANGLHPDGKSDVWSLGVLLFRMLSGRVPFQGERETFTLLAVKINKEPTPDLLRLRREVPAGVVRAIEAALRKPPADRPTMPEFMRLLLRTDAAPGAVVPELSITAPKPTRQPVESQSIANAPTRIMPAPSLPTASSAPPSPPPRRPPRGSGDGKR